MNQATINEATRLQNVYKDLANQKGIQTMQADYPGAEAHFLPADRFGYPNKNGLHPWQASGTIFITQFLKHPGPAPLLMTTNRMQ